MLFCRPAHSAPEEETPESVDPVVDADTDRIQYCQERTDAAERQIFDVCGKLEWINGTPKGRVIR